MKTHLTYPFYNFYIKDERSYLECKGAIMNRFLNTILLIATGSILAACAAGWNTPQQKEDAPLLAGTWHVEDIDQGGVIDDVSVTVQLIGENQISGSTGCNRYSGIVDLNDQAFVVSKTVSTRRACVTAIAKQEQRFLTALNEAARYTIEAQIWLVIYDASDKPRLKLTRIKSKQQPQHSKMDQTLPGKVSFRCQAIGMASLRFLGPETIEVSTGKQVEVLHRKPTASGALYSGQYMQFWNKGNEAVLTLQGNSYNCTKKP
jgi:heat shock protein HslJ